MAQLLTHQWEDTEAPDLASKTRDQKRDPDSDLGYVPGRTRRDSGLIIALFLFLLTLLIWLLSAGSAHAQSGDPAPPAPPAQPTSPADPPAILEWRLAGGD